MRDCRIQNAPFGESTTADCAFPLCSTCRLRFFVRRRHVCPGEEKRILRKSALCTCGLTKRRTLRPRSHGKTQFESRDVTEKRTLRSRCDGKAHSATRAVRKSALCATAPLSARGSPTACSPSRPVQAPQGCHQQRFLPGRQPWPRRRPPQTGSQQGGPCHPPDPRRPCERS